MVRGGTAVHAARLLPYTAMTLLFVLLLLPTAELYATGHPSNGGCDGGSDTCASGSNSDGGDGAKLEVRYCDGYTAAARGDDDADADAFVRSHAASFAALEAEMEASQKRYEAAGGDCENDCYERTLDASLEVWRDRGTISRADVDAALARGYATVHYVLEGGELYRRGRCLFGARCEGVEHFLLRLLDADRRAGRPPRHVELAINVADHPQVHTRGPPPVPLFSFSVTANQADIMYPAWSFWSGGPAVSGLGAGLREVGRWDMVAPYLVEAGAQAGPLGDRDPRLFFRGSRTDAERDGAVLLSRDLPRLIDARFTGSQSTRIREAMAEAGFTDEDIRENASLAQHCRYRYLLNFRGQAASFRLRHLFACGSVVFHVGEEWQEFFYGDLWPWVHFVPVRADLSDLQAKLAFLRAHPLVGYRIADAGQQFVLRHLRTEDVDDYWRRLLDRYSALLGDDFVPVSARATAVSAAGHESDTEHFLHITV